MRCDWQTLVLQVDRGMSCRFTRLMRPVFGYIVAITWGAQMLALAFVILFKTDQAAGVITAMGSLSTVWGVGLSVLGIYVYKRSEDKKLEKQE